jgi:PAS domain S-box-containing protein
MMERRSPGRRRFDKLAVGQTLESTFVISPDGVIVDVSASVSRLLGFDGEEILGMSFRDLLHPGGGGIATDVIAESLGRPEEKVVAEVRTRRRDGALCVADLTCVNRLAEIGSSPSWCKRPRRGTRCSARAR